MKERENRMPTESDHWVYVAQKEDVNTAGCLPANVSGHTIVLFVDGNKIYAVDNRCPHMGFPLERGTIKNGILTCHWHHARFDLASGGTFDQWADDVRAFPVDVRGEEVWVDLTPRANARTHYRQRLGDGLERNISLVIAKSAIALTDSAEDPAEPFRIGLDFGTRYRQAGWGQGLTMLTCFMNLLPHLDAVDRPRALYHGLAAVARESSNTPPRFAVRPLPAATADLHTLKKWFRQFIEVRDAEGAERCIVSAVQAGANSRQMADMFFAAATDHRYLQIGHVADFTNKALEALDLAGWEPNRAEQVLTSLAAGYANANRMEESNAWRNPLDLIAILEQTFDKIPAALQTGRGVQRRWSERDPLVKVLLGEDPRAIVDALIAALSEGCSPTELAGEVAYAAALRIARFHTSNEFSDWDTALHTFTFANAIHLGLRRTPTPIGADLYPPILRGVFDAAMSIYLDRFLNVPPAHLPEPENRSVQPGAALDELTSLLDRQQQVDAAGERVGGYLFSGGEAGPLLAMLGKLLLREDRDFHTIQTVEAAFAQYALLSKNRSDGVTPAAVHVLVAAARYLAAHAPTMRAQGQTYQIAYRLSRGERLFEE
jgi:nitrite reductase/ring-hydroxylating ferredoxin subunit